MTRRGVVLLTHVVDRESVALARQKVNRLLVGSAPSGDDHLHSADGLLHIGTLEDGRIGGWPLAILPPRPDLFRPGLSMSRSGVDQELIETCFSQENVIYNSKNHLYFLDGDIKSNCFRQSYGSVDFGPKVRGNGLLAGSSLALFDWA